MAVADTKKLLKLMIKDLNDAYARGQLDSFRQIVTLEADNIAEAWKEGYSNLVNATKHKNRSFPDIDSINFKEAVMNSWSDIKTSIENTKGTIRHYDATTIVFNESKMTKKLYDAIKSHMVDFIQEVVGDYKLTGAKEEAELNGAPSKDIPKFAGRSDVGIIKKGTHRLHKGNTAVGSARLALSLKWMSKTRFFKSFLSSKEAKAIQDKYGDLIATWETKGTKKRGLRLEVDEDIKISVGAGETNKAGDEPEDFSEIFKELKKAVMAWAKEQELAGVKGSVSIRDNAINVAEHAVVANLKTISGSKVKKKTKGSTRDAKSVSVSKAAKSMKGKVKAKGRVKKRKRKVATKRTPAMQPLHLIGLINKKLPETVRKNMQNPGLENQTGRFAESVRITDIGTTAQGFASIGYTYRKDPYQVFEDGTGVAPWANGQRDPRQLIDKSIREIAAQFAIGRFYTRRE